MTLTKNTEILRAAAHAALFAANAARATTSAAASSDDSVNAAAYAASVAKAAEAVVRARLRQRDTLLALIAAADTGLTRRNLYGWFQERSPRKFIVPEGAIKKDNKADQNQLKRVAEKVGE